MISTSITATGSALAALRPLGTSERGAYIAHLLASYARTAARCTGVNEPSPRPSPDSGERAEIVHVRLDDVTAAQTSPNRSVVVAALVEDGLRDAKQALGVLCDAGVEPEEIVRAYAVLCELRPTSKDSVQRALAFGRTERRVSATTELLAESKVVADSFAQLLRAVPPTEGALAFAIASMESKTS